MVGLADRIELAARRALDDAPTADWALSWYSRARAFCQQEAQRTGRPLAVIVGIVAALSPRNNWDTQLRDTPAVLDALAQRKPIPGAGLGANKRKATLIWHKHEPLQVLGGEKVRAFYASILGDNDSVCIDVWAARAAYGNDPKSLTPKRFRECVAAYKLAAVRLQVVYPKLAQRLTARNVQALVWAYTRNPQSFYPSLF